MVTKMKFTKSLIDSLKITGKDYFLWDSEVPGFGIKISAAGRKTFVLQYRDSSRNTKRLSLGVYPALHPQTAKEKALTTWADIHKGIDPSRKSPAGVLLFKEVWEDYKKNLMKNKRSKSTLSCIQCLERACFTSLYETPMEALNRSKILSVLAEATPTMKNLGVAYLKAAFNHAILLEKISINPCDQLKVKSSRKIVRWLSSEETQRLMSTLAYFEDRAVADMLLFLYYTGARIGEAKSLQWEHIDFKNKTWLKLSHLTKQNKDSYIPLLDSALNIIKRQEKVDEFIFHGPRQLHFVWLKITKKAGITDFRIHDLRHNFASMLVSKGVSLEVIGKLLGHSSYQTTQRYAHLSHTALKEALEKLK